MKYTLYFVNDEMPEKVKMGEFNTINEADMFMASDNSEGGEALLVNNETGEEFYYCEDEETNWVGFSL